MPRIRTLKPSDSGLLYLGAWTLCNTVAKSLGGLGGGVGRFSMKWSTGATDSTAYKSLNLKSLQDRAMLRAGLHHNGLTAWFFPACQVRAFRFLNHMANFSSVWAHTDPDTIENCQKSCQTGYLRERQVEYQKKCQTECDRMPERRNAR